MNDYCDWSPSEDSVIISYANKIYLLENHAAAYASLAMQYRKEYWKSRNYGEYLNMKSSLAFKDFPLKQLYYHGFINE